jgi:ankyrin repeat protein
LAASENNAPWMRTALFGSAKALGALLDGGLDPNSEDAEGTSVLMAASPDAAKVKLLLARGADPRHRARSGYDALTVAAAAYGSREAVTALLDAGALAQPPADVRVRHSPLLFASMTGDDDVAGLLLAHGADPAGGTNVQGETPLAAAVTFGHAPVVRRLLAAGAPASLTESSGVNLLHWATITNRAAVVPALAAARVAINAQDDSGFTPLMYAATIDFGDAATLDALVAAGADRSIRNDEGRTPLQQARHYKHGRLEAALKQKP